MLLEDKKGIDIAAIDVRAIVSYADILILCSGNTDTHVNALISAIKEKFAKSFQLKYVNSSKDSSWWILDFVDVVIHVFKREERAFYDLDGLWLDAKKIKIENL